MEAGIVIALIASGSSIIVAVIGGVFTYWNNSRIDKLEDQVKELQDESCVQKKIIRRLKKYLIEWWAGIQSLLNQIGELGHDPVWQPQQPPELDEDA